MPQFEKSGNYGRTVGQSNISETVANHLEGLKRLLMNLAYSAKNMLNLYLTEKKLQEGLLFFCFLKS